MPTYSEPFDREFESADIFERAEAQERRARVDAAIVRNAEIAAQEAEQEKKRRDASRIFSLEATHRTLRAQYQAAGVEPLDVDRHGVPTVSLSLLLASGWTIQEFEGRPTLIRPPVVTQQRRGRNHDIGS